jgi:hypothetical protein
MRAAINGAQARGSALGQPPHQAGEAAAQDAVEAVWRAVNDPASRRGSTEQQF